MPAMNRTDGGLKNIRDVFLQLEIHAVARVTGWVNS